MPSLSIYCSTFLFTCAIVLSLKGNETPITETEWPPPDFAVSFDQSTVADRSHGFPEPGGFGTQIVPDGLDGSALRIEKDGGHLHYRAAGNVSADSGTIRFATRGTAISGEEGMVWLWAIRGHRYDLGLVVEDGKLFLRCTEFQIREQPTIAELSIPLVGNDPDEWHWIGASWDSLRQRAWLELDGAQVEGRLELPRGLDAPLAQYLGGGVEVRLYPGGMMRSGNEFDNLQIWMQSRALLDRYQPLSNPEMVELLEPMVEGIYRRFDTLEGLQFNGGWQVTYTWPTMLGAFAQGRGFIDTENIVSLDKSNGTPIIASRFVYAYDILGDESLLEVARKSGDFLVAAQSDEGYWLNNYQFDFGTIVPLDSRNRHSQPKFQDGVQSQSIALLLSLYKLTGESEYIISARKAGEFYLKAQNPDGSWSYKYDPEEGIGKTFLGEPQGGEINDYAMNDALNIMILLYHYTEDTRYLQAAKRAADWLVAAKMSGQVHGWAQQYDNTLSPASARHHEPPAYSSEDTLIACTALIEAYRLSGDENYLVPVQEAAQWIEEQFPDGKMFKYYDPETGRPVASWERKIYFLDDPVEFKEANQYPQNPHVIHPQPVPDIWSLLEKRNAPNVEQQGLTPLELRLARRALNTQNEAGLWIKDNVGGGRHTLGTGFGPSSVRAIHMLNFLEACYREMNLADPQLSHRGDLLRMAAPENWYDVPWPEGDTETEPNPEKAELQMGDFQVVIRTDPHFETRYGDRRFDRLGRVSSVQWKGREFLTSDGLVDEFSASGLGILGWDPLEATRDFVKIGVGEMEAFHAAKPHYMNAQPHRVQRVFPSKRDVGADWWHATQSVDSSGGVRYEYSKRITIDPPANLLIEYSLKNLSGTSISFDQYNHAFFSVPEGAETIELATSFSWEPIGSGIESGESFTYSPVEKPRIQRYRAIEEEQSSLLRLAFFPSGISVSLSLSPSVEALHCYQDRGQFCPELYFATKLDPGETAKWSREFRFDDSDLRFVTNNDR
ncbi:pectate lyase [Puniceicoccus vermicola]|uniref:Glycoside hydrolase family 88 protein n=1 Tax=Puniceicoccus vermicola TaxID=388746 RepID=A0A7X1E5L5_9BACT|nr:pectate lyase [Puniceicoccus vermicola]MBC2601717.1 glycoside hydrolase family 88 protein [Puniceicoccus vermicola]